MYVLRKFLRENTSDTNKFDAKRLQFRPVNQSILRNDSESGDSQSACDAVFGIQRCCEDTVLTPMTGLVSAIRTRVRVRVMAEVERSAKDDLVTGGAVILVFGALFNEIESSRPSTLLLFAKG